VIAVVAGLLLAAAAAIAWLIAGREPHPSPPQAAHEAVEPPTPTPAPAPARGGATVAKAGTEMPPVLSKEVVPEELPKAELRDIREGRTSIGGLYWIATFANTGKVPIDHPAAVVSMFDDAGKRVGEQVGYSILEELPPGGAIPLLILASDPPKYTRIAIAPRDPREPAFPSHQVPVRIVDYEMGKDFGGRALIGTVENNRAKPVRFTQVLVVGRSSTGEAVSYASGYATAQEIAPKDASGFKVSVGTFEIEKPARYDVLAVGREP
jgi:hypothetical protein